jgi:putative acetyltransferase
LIKDTSTKEILLRGERDVDFNDIQEINTKAFGGEAEAKLIAELRKTRSYIKGLSIVLLLEGKVIGHAMFTHAYIVNRGRRFNCLALGPMSVLPEYQRRGYGSMLMEEGLLRAKECGFKAVVVLGHSNFYPKFGFIPASTKNIRSRFTTQDENFMVLELNPNALKGITGLAEYAKEFKAFLKPEIPKTETPKTQEAKTEEPKTDETKAEEPKAEEPKAEELKSIEPVKDEQVIKEEQQNDALKQNGDSTELSNKDENQS